MNRQEYYKKIPKVDIVLNDTEIQSLCEKHGRGLVTDCIRQETEQLRSVVSNGTEEEIRTAFDKFVDNLKKRILLDSEYPLRKVFNATGIILHTNLGRAPLGKVQINAAVQAMQGYSNLEFDLDSGKRGKRWTHYADLVSKVTGAQSAIAVNNNASAVTLMLSALAKGKEVIVSRGELIEIGGKFRIPDVMEQSGAVLREVGTTNRTRISDYENAITEETGALLKVHTSNYKIVGFTEDVSVEELAALGKKYNLPVLVDLGSGVLVNLEKYGLCHEPTVQEVLKQGADIVTFSGDKLLGGPQAGIIAGKREYIEKMEVHPLMRALRLDKCTIAALTATFREYLDEKRALQTIPVLQMLSRTQEELKLQADTLYENLLMNLEHVRTLCDEDMMKSTTMYDDMRLALLDNGFEINVEESVSMMGGGSLPGEEITSYAVTIKSNKKSSEEISEAMRSLPIPVIAHVKNGKIWLDMRTILSEEVEMFTKMCRMVLEG